MWGRRILRFVAVIGLVGAWAAPCAGAGTPIFQGYEVLYTGTGTFSSQVRTLSSPACGAVTSVRYEKAAFSWSTHYNLRVGFGSGGFTGSTTRTQSQALSSASNNVEVGLSVTGCRHGLADCQGQSGPAPGRQARLQVPSVPRRPNGVFKVDAVAPFYGFTGHGFYGQWSPTLDAFSCDAEYNDAMMLVPLFDPGSALRASFSVPLSTLRSLPGGRSLTFAASPGNNAPQAPNDCQAADGCVTERMSWQGQITITRSS